MYETEMPGLSEEEANLDEFVVALQLATQVLQLALGEDSLAVLALQLVLLLHDLRKRLRVTKPSGHSMIVD